MTGDALLELTVNSQDLGEVTVREYMQEALKRLFHEGEGFSGKRPFGNSGWEDEVPTAFVRGGALKGELELEDEDEPDGRVSAYGYDERQLERLLRLAIEAL